MRIKPLLCIMSPRDIPTIKGKFDNITFIDKVWFKYMPFEQVMATIENYFLSHTRYTHLILNSDDGAPDPEHVAMILADVRKYNLPVVCGCCTIDMAHGKLDLSITKDQVVNDVYDTNLNYHLLPISNAHQNALIKVWWQGNALGCYRRDIVEKVRLWHPEVSTKSSWGRCGDLSWSYFCAKYNVPQYCDLRVFFPHSKGIGIIYNNGERPSSIIFEPATTSVPESRPARLETEQ